MTFEMRNVQYMPKELKPGTLYVSRKFDIAIHLCACGCGAKVKTPLGATEWSVKETKTGPTLRPSVGNWQQPCQSHYWITGGKVEWAEKCSPEEIASGRRHEESRRREYYDALDRTRDGVARRLWRWLIGLFGW